MNQFPKFLFYTLLLLQIYSCETENNTCTGNEEFINWSLNDDISVDVYDDIAVHFVDNRMLYISACRIETLDWPGFSIRYDFIEQTVEYDAGSKIADGSLIKTSVGNLEITVTEFSNEGEFICLNFDNGEFSGEIKARLDKIVQSGTVRGMVWEDENNNGLRESSEDLLTNAHIRVNLKTDLQNLEEGDSKYSPYYYPIDSIKTNDSGEFTIEGVFSDHPVKLRFIAYDDYEVSPANQGFDDSFDSDFYLSRELSSSKWFETDGFIIPEGGSINHIGLGLTEK